MIHHVPCRRTIQTCFLLVCALLTQTTFSRRPTLTVFVHGTVRWYLAFASPSWFSTGHADDTMLYSKLLKKSRLDPKRYEQQLMLEPGFIRIPRAIIQATRTGKLPADQAGFGGYYMVCAYDAIVQEIGAGHSDDSYALFGWSGLNSQHARQQAGVDLYESLCAWRDKYKKKHKVTPRIHIVAYSHGGAVALWMASTEKEQKKDLRIDLLTVFGTPMQVEISRFLIADMFRSIVACRSAGDTVQTLDAFSTVIGESFSQMRELVNLDRLNRLKPHLHRADIMLSINHDTYKIDHYNMFALARNSLHQALDPFPIVVFTPAIIQQVHQHFTHNSLRARITCGQDLLTVALKSSHFYYPMPLGESANLYEAIRRERKILNRYWLSPELRKESSAKQRDT